MSAQLTLSAELRKLVEARLEQTLKGIKDTLNQIFEKQKNYAARTERRTEKPRRKLHHPIPEMESGNPLHAFP